MSSFKKTIWIFISFPLLPEKTSNDQFCTKNARKTASYNNEILLYCLKWNISNNFPRLPLENVLDNMEKALRKRPVE